MNKNSFLYLIIFSLMLVGGFNYAFPFASKEDPALYDVLADMNLPLLVINTVDEEEPTCDAVEPPEGAWGHSIANATKVPASMQIILHRDTLYDSGSYVKKESGLTVKIRGNNSGQNPKKPYKLKLQKKADLLLRGDKKYKDKDWVLLRNSSLVTPIGFWTSELIGQDWTPGYEIVNLWMNGSYRGIYILCEQVTVNPDCRINIDENEGYVIENDPYWWNEDLYFSSNITVPQMKFTYKYPDPEDITDEWHKAIMDDVYYNEAKIIDGTFDEVYDCESFAKWLIGWNILGNYDGAGGNMFLVKKDASSKICMGPMWDFDQIFVEGYRWIEVHRYNLFYYNSFLSSSNDSFRRALIQVWKEKGRFVVDNLIERINAFAESNISVDYQQSRDYQQMFGIYQDASLDYVGNLEYMRSYAIDFITKRADWIDAHIYEICDVKEIKSESGVQKSDIFYDILGRPVLNNTPGILLKNGKKIIVRP